MPVRKIKFQSGVNRENTSYTNEGRWYDTDKVRFRQGYPEKIGGWQRISDNNFLGVCRSLWRWVTLENIPTTGVGTHLKFYLERGGVYYDITPIRATETLTNPFTTSSGSTTVTVTDANLGYRNGDFVTFSGATSVGGLTLNDEYQITFSTGNTYTIEAASAATSSASGGGTVTATYQVNTGSETSVPLSGFGLGAFGSGEFGIGDSTAGQDEPIRIWFQATFGEDLLFAHKSSEIYYWDATNAIETRAVPLKDEAGASEVPTVVNFIMVSDISRFVFAMGCNPVGSAVVDPLIIRWSDQEDALQWNPLATNQAGSLRLSRGSEIVTAQQSRQEILVWTDAALYSLQYIAPPDVWSAQLMGDNISIVSPMATAYANGVTYWMGRDRFYIYDGRVQPLPCDVRRYVFGNIDKPNYDQVFAGTVEEFNEIWWFYPDTTSGGQISRYVIYNYVDNTWAIGELGRTAWLDSGLRDYPLAATYNGRLVDQEIGQDNRENTETLPISAHAETAQFDIEDGDRFMFIRKLIPDVTFDGSDSSSPAVQMSLSPLREPGHGYNDPKSEGGVNTLPVTRTSTVTVEQFTSQLNIRVRGRQMVFKISSDEVGVYWKLGSIRADMRPDGRRG